MKSVRGDSRRKNIRDLLCVHGVSYYEPCESRRVSKALSLGCKLVRVFNQREDESVLRTGLDDV